jgi:hypothetical protein
MQKLRESFSQAFHRRRPLQGRVTSVIETDFLPAEVENRPGDKTFTTSENAGYSPNGSYGTFDDHVEEVLCQELALRLQEAVTEDRHHHRCELLLPSGMLGRVAADIVRMSQCEPCGLRGCVIYMNLEQKSASRRVGKLVYDPETVATFELYLTFLEDVKHWMHLCEFVKSTLNSCLRAPRYRQVIISQGFQLVKKKLYRPNN